MFCTQCGTNNSDQNSRCVNCGAPLRKPQYVGYAQPSHNGYAQPAQTLNTAPHAKPTVLYIVTGAIAALGILLVFLPQFSYTHSGSNGFTHIYNVFGLNTMVNDAASVSAGFSDDSLRASQIASAVCIIMFMVPIVLRAVWALLSFLQKRPAGVFGIISSVTLLIAGGIWSILIAVLSESSRDNSYVTIEMTAVPPLIVMVAVAGIPLSIMQLVKKKYL